MCDNNININKNNFNHLKFLKMFLPLNNLSFSLSFTLKKEKWLKHPRYDDDTTYFCNERK